MLESISLESIARWLGAGLGGALLACTAVPSEAPLADFDLVVINIDTLRADHLGFHGYPRDTSPFLDHLASEGVVFERATANSSYTRESVAALLTGRLPSRGGAAGWHAAPPTSGPHLGETLARAGYRTAFLSNTVMLRNPGFTRGFETVQHLPRRWNLSRAGPRLTQRALAFIDAAGDGPVALYLHYLDPHGPYDPSPPFRNRIPVPASAERLALYDDVEPRLSELLAEGFGPGDPRFEDWVARYDAEIAATDAAIAALFEGLAVRGRLERTLVVVTADHGEEFLEHGWVEHGWTLFAESVHVPLLFWSPSLAPARVTTRVSQVDVLPSLAELLGLDAGGSGMDGVPLFAGTRPAPPTRPQIAEVLLPRRNVLRSLTHEGWRYIAVYRFTPPERRHGASKPAEIPPHPVSESLYQLDHDPGERRDLAASEPERVASMRALLEHHAGALQTREAVPAPDVDPAEAERLRALGYH